MDKPDFIGRDALVGKDTRSCLLGLTCETITPLSESAVIDNGIRVGYITAGVPSPTLGLGVGYVRFYEPGEWIGRTLSMQMPDGATHEGTIVDLPFFDKEKRLVKGLDSNLPKLPEKGFV